MTQYNAGEVIRAGERLVLAVDDDGNWLAKVAGRELKRPTRAQLITEIDRVMRLEEKAVHIPITVAEAKNGYLTVKHGVATGVHAGTGKPLVSWDDGTNGQLSEGASYGTDVMRRLLPEEEVTLRRLTKEFSDKADELRSYRSSRAVYGGTKGLVKHVNELLAKDGK